MNTYSVHLYIGKDMAPIAGAISNHINNWGGDNTHDYIHIHTIKKDNNNYIIKEYGKESETITDDTIGKHYFTQLFSKTISIGKGVGNSSSQLYLCIYLQLYDKDQLECLKKITEWVNSSKCSYIVDIYGISFDLANIFCVSAAERSQIIYKAEQNEKNTKDAINYIVDEISTKQDISRFLLIQNKNFNGIGLNLDKNTFIRILSEFAILSSEQYYDIFNQASSVTDKHEIHGIGISALWFNKTYFLNYMRAHAMLKELNEAGINEEVNYLPILLDAQTFIERNLSLLDDCTTNSGNLELFKNSLFELLSNKRLTLKERKVLYALLLQDDDELIDDNFIFDEYPVLDKCFKEAINLFITENNKIISEGGGSVLSAPIKNGYVYNPIDILSELKAAIRKSRKFIITNNEVLKGIQCNVDTDNSDVIIDGEYVFQNNKFKLQDNTKIELFEDTYKSHEINVTSVDLRKKFSPVRHQGGIGSCCAFATSSIFEYILNSFDNSTSNVLSPRFLYYNICDKNSDGTPIDKGSNYFNVIQSLSSQGICKEDLCPYTSDFSVSPSQEAMNEATSRLVTQAMNVNICHKDITSALADGYPVGIALKLFNSFKPNSRGFIFRPSEGEINNYDNNTGWHAMVICGFSEKQKVYIVRNSWGKEFGDNGYCYIPFSYIEDPKLCCQACIITAVSCNQLNSPVIANNFNISLDSQDAKYAALRILIEEEKCHLRELENDYASLQAKYTKLLKELNDNNLRSKIIEHAINRYNTSGVQQVIGQEESLSFFAKIIKAILAFFGLSRKKDSPVTIPVNYQIDQTLINKFKIASTLISTLQELKESLPNNYKKISILFKHLNTLNRIYLDNCQTLCDNLKAPFISILSEEDYKRIFEAYNEQYTHKISLIELFDAQNLVEHKKFDPVKLTDTILENIEDCINESYIEFSMYRYLTQDTFEPFNADQMQKLKYLSQIESDSLPFVEHHIGHPDNARKIIFATCDDNNQQSTFEAFSKQKFAKSPLSCLGGTQYKLTYFQISGFNRDELKLFKS